MGPRHPYPSPGPRWKIVAMVLLLPLAGMVGAQSCSSTADLGAEHCVKFSSYDAAQPAVCLSLAYTIPYMKNKFNDDVHCRSGADICWFQCMAEEFGLYSGTVAQLCRCDDSVPTEDPADRDLDPSCYSPSGEDCTWYRDCLEKKYSCSGSGAGYAIEYAEKYCSLYDERLDKFSIMGQQWVSAVRKCLQQQLVPALRSFAPKTCTALRDTAFRSHDGCYLQPPGGPSVCALSCADMFSIFWTVKGALTTAFGATMTSMYNVIVDCVANKPFYDTTCLPLKLLTKVVRISYTGADRRRAGSSGDSLSDDDVTSLADAIETLAETLGWSAENLAYFVAYPDIDTADTGNVTFKNAGYVDLVMSYQTAVDLLASNPNADVSSYQAKLEQQVSGLLQKAAAYHGENGGFMLQSVAACTDVSCSAFSSNATFAAVGTSGDSNDGGAALEPYAVAIIAVVAVVVILVGTVFLIRRYSAKRAVGQMWG